MSETIVTTRVPSSVFEIVNSLGDFISGDKADQYGIRDCFFGAFTLSLATSVHDAFLVKSAHGKDELGNSWPDLEDRTKAYSRPDARAGLATYKGKPTPYGNTHRPTLTENQDKQWRRVFVTQLTQLRTVMSGKEAASLAAEKAWAYVKNQMGATTILAYAKNRIIPLLQKSGRLEQSLKPGTIIGNEYHPPDDQIYTLDKNELTWGTRVEYASRVDKKRPLWPKEIDPWITRAVEAGIDAIIQRLKEVL